jgi:hypothetical protein
MTSAELQAALEAHDTEHCITLFATATEAERRAMAKTAAARLRRLTTGVPSRFTQLLLVETLDKLLTPIFPASILSGRGGLQAAQVAVLATATLQELKKFGERCLPSNDNCVAVLTARRPSWVADWAKTILSWSDDPRSLYRADHWRLVRRLVREGLCARPRGPRYIDGMLSAIPCHFPDRRKSVREELLNDPELLDNEVWEIFETEPTPGLLGLLLVDPSFPEMRWDVALAEFANEGRLSRARLLDASLSGLERDYHEVRARWFVLMYETLNPTLDERAEHVGRYLGLTASRNPSTATFCLRSLAVLDKAGRLKPGPLLDAIGPALLARAKGQVRSALALIDRAARRAPELGNRAASVAVSALTHESPAVHEAALDLIERYGQSNDRTLVHLLDERMETIAASQRARVAVWLGRGSSGQPRIAAEDDLLSLLARASALDPSLAELAGVPTAVAVLKQSARELPALEFSEMDVPRLDPEKAISPVEDLDELIGLFSTVLEDPGNPDDLERVLDGVSRLCDRIPCDFVARTDPLRARATRLNPLSPMLSQALCGLALGWITEHQAPVTYADLKDHLVGVFARRVRAIAWRVAVRQSAPLLSAPTHVGGWIDPDVLVKRVKIWASLSFRMDELDGPLALLRLAPDRAARAEALKRAARLEGPYAQALRHALGGDGEVVGPDAALWVAAARARAPRDDDRLVEARHPRLGPDAGLAARCSLLAEARTASDRRAVRRLFSYADRTRAANTRVCLPRFAYSACSLPTCARGRP